VARQLNRWLLAHPAGEQYFTLLYGILNVRTRQLRYVSAGHPPLVRVNASGLSLLRVPGYPIGCFGDADYEETVLQLAPGDRLFLYSDGVTEALHREVEPFGMARLQRAVAACAGEPLEACTRQLVREASQWAGDAPQDDLSVLALAVD
jgi:sigma-B regulation protein RsbU (phosphoserine phosphatase)